jgi:hypothetical protein
MRRPHRNNTESRHRTPLKVKQINADVVAVNVKMCFMCQPACPNWPINESKSACRRVTFMMERYDRLTPCDVRSWLPAQPIDATQTLNLSAGVSNCKGLT